MLFSRGPCFGTGVTAAYSRDLSRCSGHTLPRLCSSSALRLRDAETMVNLGCFRRESACTPPRCGPFMPSNSTRTHVLIQPADLLHADVHLVRSNTSAPKECGGPRAERATSTRAAGSITRPRHRSTTPTTEQLCELLDQLSLDCRFVFAVRSDQEPYDQHFMQVYREDEQEYRASDEAHHFGVHQLRTPTSCRHDRQPAGRRTTLGGPRWRGGRWPSSWPSRGRA
jgi:hypothetical protein